MAKLLTREEILKPRFEPFSCPDRGEFLLLPYISGGAMDAYLSAKQDPIVAFARLFSHSVTEDGPTFESLSEADCDVLAEFFAQTVGASDAYRSARREQGVFDSFAHSFLNSELVVEHLRINESLARQIRQTELKMARMISPTQQMDLSLKVMRPFAVSGLSCKFPDAISGFKVQKALADSIAVRAQVISDLSLRFDKEMETWKRLASDQTFTAAIMKNLDRDFARFADQIRGIQSIIKPAENLHRAFVDLADRIIANPSLSTDALALADATLAQANAVVTATNDHFSHHRTVVMPQMPAGLSEEAANAGRDFGNAVSTSEFLLHEEASDLVLVGSDATEKIAGLLQSRMEARLDERLQPYQNLLERLSALSRPPTFQELLREFAILVGREFWSNLWVRPGDEWLSRPERIGQGLLGMFLHGRWAGVAFVGKEIASGDGFVDLLVHFLGVDFIVELKVVGAGWGIGYAKSGLDQLDTYMGNYSRSESYLLVFDGRKTLSGEQLSPEYSLRNGSVHVVTVRVYQEAPSCSKRSTGA